MQCPGTSSRQSQVPLLASDQVVCAHVREDKLEPAVLLLICSSPGLPASFLLDVLSLRTALWSSDGDKPAFRRSTQG